MVGFLHKRILGDYLPTLLTLPPARQTSEYDFHSKQFELHFGEVCAHRKLYSNSLYTYILIYNRLPQELVDCKSVTVFQNRLTQLTKMRVQQDVAQAWRQAFQLCSDRDSFMHNIKCSSDVADMARAPNVEISVTAVFLLV